MPSGLVTDAWRNSSSQRSALVARCSVPVGSHPVDNPVSASSVVNTSMLRFTTWRMPDVGRAVVINPAACQVVPEVSWLRSSSTTSVQPRRARW